MSLSPKRPVAGFVVLLFAVLSIGLSQIASSAKLGNSRAAGLESCVAPTADMRRNHMEYLFHKRDKTMREGIRTPEFSMNECVSCHASKDDAGHYIPVTDKGQFCQACHARISQKLDCFQCHRTTPES